MRRLPDLTASAAPVLNGRQDVNYRPLEDQKVSHALRIEHQGNMYRGG